VNEGWARGVVAVWLAAASIIPAAAAAAPRSNTLVAPAPTIPPILRLQTSAEALAYDAREYARQNGLGLDEAVRRLRAQEDSVAATDGIAQEFAGRLAGISIEHHPDYRIVVLLTGDVPVPDRTIVAGGMTMPVQFRTGAVATRAQLVDAIVRHRRLIEDRARSKGIGVDPRTGELVVIVKDNAPAAEVPQQMAAELSELVGVPVRIRILVGAQTNSQLSGGARVVGIAPDDGKRYACTTGFVVMNGADSGIVTAAHCPDDLTYLDQDGSRIPLTFVGEWGARYQDVQVHLAAQPPQPHFFVDPARTTARRVASWRLRDSTRAGDVVCHRGESSGYSCSLVELVDYAPPASLCGGPCDPSWVTVAGPACRNGDSGGPVFSGTIAFGILKGGSYASDGTCNFYYYMSTDYLPNGWTLVH
jgi:hypothetical protein